MQWSTVLLFATVAPMAAEEDNSGWGVWAALANTKCFGSALRSGFITGLIDYDRYGEWMGEDAIMQLAQAGEYFGPDGIAEYLAFATSDSPYFLKNFNYMRALTNIRPRGGWDEEAGECVITVALWSRYSMTGITVPTKTVAFAGMMKLFFSPIDTPARIAIRRINIFYDAPFLTWFFGTATNTDGVKSYICDVLHSKCEAAWELSELRSLEDCRRRMDMLPATTSQADGLSVSGNSLGCRVLHAAFAETNPENHCAHLSFAPMEDPKGRIKCQNDTAVDPSELFTKDDMAFYHAYLRKHAAVLNPNEGYRVVEYGNECSPAAGDCDQNTFCKCRNLAAMEDCACAPTAAETVFWPPWWSPDPEPF